MAMIPITFAGATNFKSNLYALEVRSRFIDQNHANGYYKGYGEELRASVSGNVITVGSGAFLVQGRALEIDAGGETVSVDTTQSGNVGYLLARIETRPGEDGANCTLTVKTAGSLDAIKLTKEDTYERDSETENRVCELPLYSFRIVDDAITELTLLVDAIDESRVTREIAENAQQAAEASARAAKAAQEAAQNAEAVQDMEKIIDTVMERLTAAPTLNTKKQLTEGYGFYYVIIHEDGSPNYCFGAVYWEEGKKSTLPIHTEFVGGYGEYLMQVTVDFDGKLHIWRKNKEVPDKEDTIFEDTDSWDIYTKKIG